MEAPLKLAEIILKNSFNPKKINVLKLRSQSTVQ